MKKVLYLLGQLTDTDVEWLIANGRKESIAAGSTIVRAGEAGGSQFFIVLRGGFSVSVPGLNDQATPKLGCGEVVGEMSFVDARPSSATVTAMEDSVVLSLPRRELVGKLEHDQGFAARFFRSVAMFLSHRLRAREQRMAYAQGQGLNEHAEYEDEIDSNVLDNVHLAGSRFERVLQRMLTS